MLALRQLEAVFHRMREALRTRLVRGRWSGYAFEFLAFGIKQGWACLFGALMLARVWRLFDFRYDRFPPLWLQGLLALAVYVNFFTHHFTLDIRLGLFVASVLIYGPCVIWFRPDRVHRCMPLVLGLVLVALFIWFAENIGTFARAWAYPGQEAGWHMVSLAKLGAWYLLMIISFVLVAAVHRASGQRLRAPR